MAMSRNEAIIENILGADNVLVDPQSRIEEILQAILYEDEYTEQPESRIEKILIAILNETECDITVPQSENEAILLYILNKAIWEGNPTSRMATLLQLWSKQEADPERFAFPFAISHDGVEMSVVE